MSEGWVYNTPASTPSWGPKIAAISIMFTVLSLIVVCMRLYVRLHMIKAFGIDDFIIIPTWIMAAGFTVVTIFQTKWGLGLTELAHLPTKNIIPFGIYQYAGAPFYILGILGFKLALLFSYLRFIRTGFWRYATIVTIILCTMFHLTFLLVQINLCSPIERQWNPYVAGKCVNAVAFYTSMASLTMFFDVAVMVLPFPVLLKSQIQTRKKMVLLVMLGTGIFLTIIQAVRIQTIKKLANYLDSEPIIRWSVVESNVGIIVSCLPTLGPLFKYFSSTVSGSRSRDKNSAARGNYNSTSLAKPTSTGSSRRPSEPIQLNNYFKTSSTRDNDVHQQFYSDGSTATREDDAASTKPMLSHHKNRQQRSGIVKSMDVIVSNTMSHV